MIYFLHIALSFAWIPLGLIAFSTRKSKKIFCTFSSFTALSLILCVYVLYTAFIWSKTVVNPIRIDFLLIIPIFSILYLTLGFFGLILWKRSHSRVVLFSSSLLVLISTATLINLIVSTLDFRQRLAKLDSVPSLLFAAQFKSAGNFQKTFGSIDSSENTIAGHYLAEPQSWATRIVINTQSHLFLYSWCGFSAKSECVHSEADLLNETKNLPANAIFKSQLVSTLSYEGEFTNVGADHFTLSLYSTFNGQKQLYAAPVTFNKSSPPLSEISDKIAGIKYWGAYSQINTKRINTDNIELIQLWLWQAGSKFMAYYIRFNSACDAQNDFITPSFLEGEKVGDEVKLSKPNNNEYLVLKEITENKIEGDVFWYGKPLETISLLPQSIIYNNRFEIAPLENYEVTRDWLKTVIMGDMIQWKAECDSFMK
jgi:hypothetical protein